MLAPVSHCTSSVIHRKACRSEPECWRMCPGRDSVRSGHKA